jgi:putative ABC transport system permease protein
MKALDRKLLRDLRLMWSQALTIALVVASGIGGFITTLSAVDSLALARDASTPRAASPTSSPAVKRAPRRAGGDAAPAARRGRRADDDRAGRAHRAAGVDDPVIGQLIGIDPRARRA